MLARRIIPCLDVKDGRTVKGINFVNLRDAGDPVEQAQIYDREGADELVFLDITASHEGRGLMLDIARRVAESVFIPFTVVVYNFVQEPWIRKHSRISPRNRILVVFFDNVTNNFNKTPVGKINQSAVRGIKLEKISR